MTYFGNLSGGVTPNTASSQGAVGVAQREGQSVRDIFNADMQVAQQKTLGITDAIVGMKQGIDLSQSMQKIEQTEIALQGKKLELERESRLNELEKKTQGRQLEFMEKLKSNDPAEVLQSITDYKDVIALNPKNKEAALTSLQIMSTDPKTPQAVKDLIASEYRPLLDSNFQKLDLDKQRYDHQHKNRMTEIAARDDDRQAQIRLQSRLRPAGRSGQQKQPKVPDLYFNPEVVSAAKKLGVPIQDAVSSMRMSEKTVGPEDIQKDPSLKLGDKFIDIGPPGRSISLPATKELRKQMTEATKYAAMARGSLEQPRGSQEAPRTFQEEYEELQAIPENEALRNIPYEQVISKIDNANKIRARAGLAPLTPEEFKRESDRYKREGLPVENVAKELYNKSGAKRPWNSLPTSIKKEFRAKAKKEQKQAKEATNKRLEKDAKKLYEQERKAIPTMPSWSNASKADKDYFYKEADKMLKTAAIANRFNSAGQANTPTRNSNSQVSSIIQDIANISR